MAIVFKEGDPLDTGLTVEAASEPPSKIMKSSQRKKHMLFNARLSDVTFIVGATKQKKKKIAAHTFLLSEASEVFEAMFSDNWKKDEPIHVIDCEAPTFCSLLRWIYCDELIFPPGMLADVTRIAQKYMVHSLISFVTDNAEKYVWSLHAMAIDLEMPDLVQKSLNLIKSKQATHMASADFLNASCESVTAFVSLDRSNVTELQVFKRCLEWSAKECERQGLEVLEPNQRMVMEPFIYEISFESMTAADFAGLPCESGILTEEEQAIILRTIAGQKLENRFKKKQQPKGKRCRNWKSATAVHFRCTHCQRYVCMDCFAAGIGKNADLACSNCRSRAFLHKPYMQTVHIASRDFCAGSP